MDFNFTKIEKDILKFWERDKIFEKSVKQRKDLEFVFYEGPPTANGRPGIHHVLSRVFKDIICRFRAMQGYRVVRKAGWDTHGLPVELEVEKKLGLKNKKEIEAFGVAKFNKLCKKSVWTYLIEWQKLTKSIGFWLDLDQPYITYQNEYIESVWWIVKELSNKKLLYQDYKVIPYCARCGTGLSSHEVAQGYKEVADPSVFFKLKIVDPKFANASLLVWTTTPWTLPGNVAVAINPKLAYVLVDYNKEKLILAKERLVLLEGSYKVLKEFKGKELLGLKYVPLFTFSELTKAAHFVVAGDFVSAKEGTGLVHIAPAFGEDDMRVAKEHDLPVVLNVDTEGKFKKEVKPWAGLLVKEADPLIIKELAKKKVLFKEELYTHEYPFCWRCKAPLLYYARESWFINMQKVKQKLIANNQKINWVPAHLKEGRFGEWLREVKDWAFSRERYWGTPLPLWRCKECDHLEAIGSKQDLLKQKYTTNQYYILRHGHSLRNLKNIAASWPEKFHAPLTVKGKQEVEQAARSFKQLDLIFTSDLLRAQETATMVARTTGAKIIFDKRLREIDMGIFNGKPVEEAGKFWDKTGKLPLMEYYLKRFTVRAPKGENYLDVKKRMCAFLKDIDRKYKGKRILIVSHELPLTMLEATVRGWSDEETIKFREKSRIKTGETRTLPFKLLPYATDMALDLHKPYLDEVKFICPACQEGIMERVSEVLDCWFDSGAMPFAQAHFPFNKSMVFPADYICEGVDQTRGWFYTLLALATLLGKGTAYKNVISLGHVLDEKGEKMSKSKGNIVDPWYIIDKYGVDAVRWYFYTVNQPGEAKLFNEKDIALAFKRFILTFWHSYSFFKTYQAEQKIKTKNDFKKLDHVLDRWIISRLNQVILEVTASLNKYEVNVAARNIEDFLINDVSLWYIRRSRKRFIAAAPVLKFVLETLSKLSAPFVPFLSEVIYRDLNTKPVSVHLADWPLADKSLIDVKLNKDMLKVRSLVTLALAARAKAGIKVRQPLATLQINEKISAELKELIAQEVNVKEVVSGKTLKLDTRLTLALQEEGIVREFMRQIQERRKQDNLKVKDKVLVYYKCEDKLKEVLTKYKANILQEAKIKDLIFKEDLKGSEIKIATDILYLTVKKIN